MSGKTAIERLCQLLDDRGADYMTSVGATTGSMEPYQRVTVYENGILKAIIESCGGNDEAVYLQARITPEQAVEATLGRETCKDNGTIERFICSECGCRLVLQDADWEPMMWANGAAMEPTFCPNCGRKVVE